MKLYDRKINHSFARLGFKRTLFFYICNFYK